MNHVWKSKWEKTHAYVEIFLTYAIFKNPILNSIT